MTEGAGLQSVLDRGFGMLRPLTRSARDLGRRALGPFAVTDEQVMQDLGRTKKRNVAEQVYVRIMGLSLGNPDKTDPIQNIITVDDIVEMRAEAAELAKHISEGSQPYEDEANKLRLRIAEPCDSGLVIGVDQLGLNPDQLRVLPAKLFTPEGMLPDNATWFVDGPQGLGCYEPVELAGGRGHSFIYREN